MGKGLFKLGIAISVLYWLIMAYAYAHQLPGFPPPIPVSEAFHTSLIPIIIGALCWFVFGGFKKSPETKTTWKLQEQNKLREEPVMELNRPLDDGIYQISRDA